MSCSFLQGIVDGENLVLARERETYDEDEEEVEEVEEEEEERRWSFYSAFHSLKTGSNCKASTSPVYAWE